MTSKVDSPPISAKIPNCVKFDTRRGSVSSKLNDLRHPAARSSTIGDPLDTRDQCAIPSMMACSRQSLEFSLFGGTATQGQPS